MNKIRRKLNSQEGETISEVLVASLISVMALLLLATMIMSASRMVDRSDKKMTLFYEQVSAVETGKSKEPDDTKVKIDKIDNKKVKITSGGSTDADIEVIITKEENSGLTSYKKK